MFRKILQIVFAVIAVGGIIFLATREPKRPDLPRWEVQKKEMRRAEANHKARERKNQDAALVKSLLKQGLADRVFDFAVVAEAASGKKVIPLEKMESGERVRAIIENVLGNVMEDMNSDTSPIRGLRRINEGSRYFEDGLIAGLNEQEGILCEVPKTVAGKSQRSGYPDLKITDEETGEVYYLDPKLMEQGSEDSSFRSFYFEPKGETLKITDDATHLLVGIEHDGKDGEWTFLGWRFIDLSKLQVSLKAEFHASNRDMYEGVARKEDGE
ncbi:hypothetical protein [Luteolibacter sp. AS25]|uniref:hypothetical protein n=1 Tax=Luteolibacter sp. AS25 TaxID=3135776 RepID=UPI00398ABEA3